MVADFTYLNSARSTSCQQFRPERRQRPQRQKWQSCAQTLPPAALRQPTATTSATSTAAGTPASGRRFPKQESPRCPDGPTLNHGDPPTGKRGCRPLGASQRRWDGGSGPARPWLPLPCLTRPGPAQMLAIVSWDKGRSEPEYRKGLRSDAWEVVVPELVFAPQP